MIQEYMNSAVGQQYLNSATAVGQQQVPLDLVQTPKTGKKIKSFSKVVYCSKNIKIIHYANVKENCDTFYELVFVF